MSSSAMYKESNNMRDAAAQLNPTSGNCNNYFMDLWKCDILSKIPV